MCRYSSTVTVLLVVLTTHTLLAQEGSPQLNERQIVSTETRFYVDVLSPSEEIVYSGYSDLNIYAPVANPTPNGPRGSLVATLDAPGGSYTSASGVGAYELEMVTDDCVPATDDCSWNIRITGAPAARGRMWSFDWHFRASGHLLNEAVGICEGTYPSTSDCVASFYAVVDGGEPGHQAVIEVQTHGLGGQAYEISANPLGATLESDGLVVGYANGRSRPECEDYDDTGGGTLTCVAEARPLIEPEYRVYLQPPEDASDDPAVPDVTFTGLATDSEECDDIIGYGLVNGLIHFESNVSGTYHVICDVGGSVCTRDEEDYPCPDGVFDFTSDEDAHLLGRAEAGANEVVWDATDNAGRPIANAWPSSVNQLDYECLVMLTVGELHFVVHDIETSFQGLGLYNVQANLARVPLRMYWNDSAVAQNAAASMPSAAGESLHSSGRFGVEPEAPYDASQPDPVPCTQASGPDNCDGRAWGNQTGGPLGSPANKGDQAFLDTYTWVGADITETFTFTVYDHLYDADLEGLPDVEEICVYATNPTLGDTDEDGLSDYTEAREMGCNPLAEDSDGDCVPDGVEMPTATTNTDGDALVDCLDDDDDNDCVLTCDEDVDGNGDPTDDDSDGDDTPDYLDSDDGIGGCGGPGDADAGDLGDDLRGDFGDGMVDETVADRADEAGVDTDDLSDTTASDQSDTAADADSDTTGSDSSGDLPSRDDNSGVEDHRESGCGCTTVPPPFQLLLLVAAALFVVRPRR